MSSVSCAASAIVHAPGLTETNETQSPRRRSRRETRAAHSAQHRHATDCFAMLRATSLLLLTLLVLPASPAFAASAAEVAADLRMASESAPMRRAVDGFVERARRGDAAAATAMLSRALVDRIGAANAERVVREQLLPFFARGGEIGRSVTITRTTDAAGQQGFAFYLWLARADAKPAPFTVYVVEERGAPVIANVVPDRLVEGRHR